MKLKNLAKRMKLAPVPSHEEEYHAILNKAATAITGAAPGDPAYEAIVNPRRGRPAKGESRTSVLTAVRLPAAVAAAAQRKAKRQHCTLHAAIRAAVTEWAMT
jgi:hypothetical protein